MRHIRLTIISAAVMAAISCVGCYMVEVQQAGDRAVLLRKSAVFSPSGACALPDPPKERTGREGGREGRGDSDYFLVQVYLYRACEAALSGDSGSATIFRNKAAELASAIMKRNGELAHDYARNVAAPETVPTCDSSCR